MTDRDQGDVGPLQLEAIDWAVRLAVGPVAPGDAQAFERWRATSPEHDLAYRQARDFCEELRALPLPANDAAAPIGAPSRRGGAGLSRRAVFAAGGGAIAASVAGGVMLTRPPLGLWPSVAELMADYRTAPGERRVLTPATGVDVELNSRSSVSTVGDGLRLVEGEMFISVAQRETPFRVDAGAGRLDTRDGVFNLRFEGGELCISCVRGAAASRLGREEIALAAGQELAYDADGRARRTVADAESVLAWRRGLLVFRATPLVDAIQQINRYFPGRLILADRAKGAAPVTGVFHVNQIELAVVQIQRLLDVRARRLPGGIVLLG